MWPNVSARKHCDGQIRSFRFLIVVFKVSFPKSSPNIMDQLSFLDLSDMLIKRSALALVNGHLWDLHRPLEENCTVELLHFHDNDPFHANRAFWRSCSFMLGAVLETVFKEDVFVELHSFPAPNGRKS